MKKLQYLTNKTKRAVWLRAFRMWQKRPHEVAPITDTIQKCSSCDTEFNGNYCPRCGQAASIGRYSFKRICLNFLDVWGIGNRSMFRSLRDLMLRPGYMIRDYISGMQSAYFPPFKMFFILVTFSILVEHGINLDLSGQEQQAEPAQVELVQEDTGSKGTEQIRNVVVFMNNLWTKNPAIFALLSLLLFSMPLYFFLRSNPNIPDLRYSEFVVALVYTSNSFSIYSIAGHLFHLFILNTIAVLMIFVSIKQFSGYSWRRVLLYIGLTILISAIVLVALITAVLSLAYHMSK